MQTSTLYFIVGGKNHFSNFFLIESCYDLCDNSQVRFYFLFQRILLHLTKSKVIFHLGKGHGYSRG